MKVYLGSVLYDPHDNLEWLVGLIRKENRERWRDLCRALRIAITGCETSPPIFEVMEILGKDECMKRLRP